MKYPLVIFDWDGTLIDSEARIVRCMQNAALDVGWQPALSYEAVRDIIGLGLPEAIRTLCPGIDEPQLQLLKERYSWHFLEASDQAMPLFPHVEEGLMRLQAAGCQLAVATGKSRKGLNQVFEETGLARYFSASRCADETRSKPDPMMLNELLHEMQLQVSDAVMVGDTEFDMALAENASMDRIAVNYGAHHPERLQKYHPVFTADQFSDLVDWLLDVSCR